MKPKIIQSSIHAVIGRTCEVALGALLSKQSSPLLICFVVFQLSTIDNLYSPSKHMVDNTKHAETFLQHRQKNYY